MTALPIVERELRARARQGTTYWSRCGLAAIAALVAAQSMELYANTVGPAGTGAATFGTLSWLGFACACIFGLVTADCISSERREGTLGLLFLTDLEGRDVVLGKLTAAGLSAFYGLIGFLPAMALVVLAGGISGGQVARTVLALLNALFLSLAAGMFISARAHNQLKAMRNTLVLTGVLFVWSWIAAHPGPMPPRKAALFALLSPYGAFYLAQDASYLAGHARFWLSLCGANIVGWFLLAAANADMKRSWQVLERVEIPPKASGEPTISGTPGKSNDASWALLHQEPICWAVSRTHGQNLFMWAGAILLLLSSGGNWLMTTGHYGLSLALMPLSSLAAGALLAWGAGRNLFEARRSGELELILSTPLGARDIVRGHWWALWRPLRAAWLLVVFMTATTCLAAPAKVLEGVALCWVGMWFGLRARKPAQVITWTVGLVIVLPVTVEFFLGLAERAALHELPGTFSFVWSRLGMFGTFGIVGAVFDLAKNAFFIWWAARRLRTELRTTAPLAASEWIK